MRSDVRSPTADYRALREGAGVVDLEGWTAIRLHGADTREFLQGMATQDLAAATSDRAGQTLFLNEKGRPVALAWVAVAPSGDEAIVVADPVGSAALRPHLERFRIMEDVEFDPPSDSAQARPTDSRSAPNPDSAPRFGRVLGVAGPSRTTLLSALAAETGGSRAIAAAGPLSFLLLSAARPDPRPPSDPQAPMPSLPHTVSPEAAEAWRIAAGLPLTGIDFDLDRIATELDLPDAISFTKGCYVGQEVVARTSNRGQVRRRRVGFRFPWPGSPPTPATPLLSKGASVGFLTSAAVEPGSGEGLGMGFLTTDALDGAEPLYLGSMDGPSVRTSPWPL